MTDQCYQSHIFSRNQIELTNCNFQEKKKRCTRFANPCLDSSCNVHHVSSSLLPPSRHPHRTPISPHRMAAPALLPPPPMDEDGAAPPAPAIPDSVPPPPPPEPKPPLPRQRPPVRVTSEFDSERRLFSHRFSCRVLDGFAKLRLRVSHGAGGGGIAWGPPDVALLAKNFSVIVDPASRGAVLRGATDLAGSLRLRASHNTKVRPAFDFLRAVSNSTSNFVAASSRSCGVINWE